MRSNVPPAMAAAGSPRTILSQSSPSPTPSALPPTILTLAVRPTSPPASTACGWCRRETLPLIPSKNVYTNGDTSAPKHFRSFQLVSTLFITDTISSQKTRCAEKLKRVETGRNRLKKTAKLLSVGSIPTPASNLYPNKYKALLVILCCDALRQKGPVYTNGDTSAF